MLLYLITLIICLQLQSLPHFKPPAEISPTTFKVIQYCPIYPISGHKPQIFLESSPRQGVPQASKHWMDSCSLNLTDISEVISDDTASKRAGLEWVLVWSVMKAQYRKTWGSDIMW